MAGSRIVVLKKQVRRVWRFVSEDVWDIELSSLSAIRRLGVQVVRVVQLVVRGFRDDQCPLHASALTFTTLIAIVPVLAVSLAVARGLGAGDRAEDRFKEMINERLGVTEVVSNGVPGVVSTNMHVVAGTGNEGTRELAIKLNGLVSKVFESVGNVSFAKLGGIGLAILVWTVVQVLGKVESSFNRVWGVTGGRPFHRKFFDYLGVVIVMPILIVAASSMPIVDLATRFVDDRTAQIIRDFMGSGLLKTLVVVLMTTVAFAFVIMFMPNAKVNIRAGFAGGFVAALLFLGWMWVCIALQVGTAKASKIYGSFAAVPIVLFWVFVSWEIVLLGAEVAFGVQNCNTYRMETHAHTASMKSRVLLALAVVTEASRPMIENVPGFQVSSFAREQNVPVRLLNEVVRDLSQQGILGELTDKPGHVVTLRPPDRLKAKDVIDALLASGSQPEELGLASLGPEFQRAVRSADAGMDSGLESLSIQDLIATK